MDGTAFLVLLLLALAVWLIIYLYKLSEKKSDTPASASIEKSETKPSPTPSTTSVKKAEQQSLDAKYAESHGMRACKYCQTLNDSGSPKCAACGKKIA